jgi:hypothetical protein
MKTKKGLSDSISLFKNELDAYFSSSRKYRAKSRTGSLVVVEPNSFVHDLIDDLVKSNDIECPSIYFDSPKNAKKAIQGMGSESVRAVILDSSLIGERVNGSNLPTWLNENHPQLPVWIRGIKSELCSARAGYLDCPESFDAFAEFLGFSKQAS